MSTILHHPSNADPRRGETFVSEAAPATSNQYLTQWLACSILIEESWSALPAETQDELSRCGDHTLLLSRLVEEGLLTPYQADRLRAGTTFGLVLGNYRVLDRIGAGAMGVVFKAEHVELRKVVAVKVLPVSPDDDPDSLNRFKAEMRVIAQLHHPNIVVAADAG